MTMPGFTAEAPLHCGTTNSKASFTPAARRGESAQTSQEYVWNSEVTPAFWRRPPYWGGCRCAHYLNGHCDLWIC
jgi:hypothetical protein